MFYLHTSKKPITLNAYFFQKYFINLSIRHGEKNRKCDDKIRSVACRRRVAQGRADHAAARTTQRVQPCESCSVDRIETRGESKPYQGIRKNRPCLLRIKCRTPATQRECSAQQRGLCELRIPRRSGESDGSGRIRGPPGAGVEKRRVVGKTRVQPTVSV